MDLILFKYFNSFADTSLAGDKVIIFFATTFGMLVILAAGLFLFQHQEERKGENAWPAFVRKGREIFFVFIVALTAWLIATLLKNLIQAMRPYDAISGVIKLFDPNDPFSLPSGHATFFAALATSIYFYHRRIGFLFGFFAILIGLARVTSGIHFPADILTGFGLGIVVAGLVAYLREKV